MKPRYSLIIPAYNEASRIDRLLSDLDDEAFEYIFACDGTDDTPNLIFSHFQDKDYHMQCLTSLERRGKGGSIIAGFNAALTPFVGFMDADSSTSLETMKNLFTCLEADVQNDPHLGAIIGSRYLKDSKITRQQPLSRRIMSRCFNFATRILFGFSYYDTQCGAKVCTKQAFDTIAKELISTGFEFDVELLLRLKNAGYIVRELPVIWMDVDCARLSRFTPFEMLRGLIRLKFRI
jgi:glycosyltransferase involved in cell wall biosynthesis